MTEKTISQQALKIAFLCACWYTFSSANSVLGKQILSVFPYPTTLSMVHFLSSTCCLGPALALLNVDPTPHLPRRFYLRRIVPLAVGKVLASISAHVSIWKVPVSYAHTVKAMMPFFTVLLSLVILRESYPLKVYLSLVPIVSGVLLATVTELSFDLTGMLAALAATLCFALQNIYSKKCMKEVHIHHLRLLLLLSQLSCILLFPFWMYTDVWELITQLHKVQHLGWLLFVLPLNGFLNFGQNIVAFSMISAVSPVSYSVANATKRIVIISSSLLFLRNPVTPFNVCGMLMSISGVAIYNKACASPLALELHFIGGIHVDQECTMASNSLRQRRMPSCTLDVDTCTLWYDDFSGEATSNAHRTQAMFPKVHCLQKDSHLVPKEAAAIETLNACTTTVQLPGSSEVASPSGSRSRMRLWERGYTPGSHYTFLTAYLTFELSKRSRKGSRSTPASQVKYDSNKQQPKPVLPTKYPDLSDDHLNSDVFRIDLSGSSPMKII